MVQNLGSQFRLIIQKIIIKMRHFEWGRVACANFLRRLEGILYLFD